MTRATVLFALAAALLFAVPFEVSGQYYFDYDDDDYSSAVAAAAVTGAVIVAAWIINLGSIPVWACGLTFGIIGIEVGRKWPSPSCCCFKGQLSGGDRRVCCPLVPSCITLLVFQGLIWIVHVVILAFGAGSSVVVGIGIITQLLDLSTIAVLIAAIVLLTNGYNEHGKPNPPADTNVTIVSAGGAFPMVPIAGVPVASPAYPQTVVVQK